MAADSIIETVHPQFPGALCLVIRPGQTFPSDDPTINRFRVRAIGSFPSGANAIVGNLIPAGQTDPQDFTLEMLDTNTFCGLWVLPLVQQGDLAEMPPAIAATVGPKITPKQQAQPAQGESLAP